MNSFNAIFKKQWKDTMANPVILLNFFLFPAVAWMMTQFAMPDFTDVPADIIAMMYANTPDMANMMAVMFAGMGLIPAVAGFIAEDIEKKSLRFLNMAGLKPMSYLLGVGSVTFIFSLVTAIAFGFISDFYGRDLFLFIGGLLSGVVASTVLGATIGMFCKNQQSATGASMPAAMVLGFGPMMAGFNESFARYLHPLYTQQLNVITDYLTLGSGDTPLWQAFAIIWANVAVIGILFTLVYVKKGLK